jgi:IS30 family transposase
MTKRCYTHLSDAERETLSLDLAHGQSLRTMATVLGRAPSTVSREYVRNAARGQPYRACTTPPPGWRPGRVSRGARVNFVDPWLWQYVKTHLLKAARPNRLPDASDARILATCRSSSRPKRSMWVCMCCPAEPCGPNC